MRRLLLRRTHPWPHRDGADIGIVEGGPSRGASAIVTAVVAGAVVLAFPLPLALTLAFAAVVGVGGRRGRGRLRTWQFLRRRAWRQQLLQRAPSGSARSPRVRGHCGWCGRRGMAAIA
jgi:hypothetical protein